MVSIKIMNQEEYYKVGETKGLPSRCPILNLCERRAWTIYLNSYLKTDPHVDIYDFLINTGDLPSDFKQNKIQLQGEAPSMIHSDSHYFFNHCCPEVNLFDDSHKIMGQRKLATCEGEWDSYYEKDKHRALEFKHYSNCAEFSYFQFIDKNKIKSQQKSSENMTNTNNNTNNNINNIHINVETPKANSSRKETNPNWYKRLIIGGLVTSILSLSGYFIKKKIDEKASVSPATIQLPIEGVKQQ